MFFLHNKWLNVSILDPVLDKYRLGSRYCTGGYIWQISDNSVGNLLSGPGYPLLQPPVFDGQGVPEVFETALGQDTAGVNDEVLVIGVGRVIRTSSVTPFHVRDNPVVKQFCSWKVELQQTFCRMETFQTFGDFSLSLTRDVQLLDRTVISRTHITNTGKEKIPLRWFAHPFFPLTNDLTCCKFSEEIRMLQNPGYFLNNDNYLAMRPDYPWNKGLYCLTDMDWGTPLNVKMCHPLLSEVEIRLMFKVSKMPVWANSNTFSFEPYFDAIANCKDTLQWSIEYCF